MQWHIFCRVIDNFGDIGVCWRLAVQLQKDHGQEVSLWVDDLAAFQQIEPEVLGATEVQTVQGIRVFHWTAQTSGLEAGSPADVVIEAFACELPAPLALALQERNPPPHWINLEYLSAEPWVTDFHLGQSPVGRLTKVFFFPGFTAGTGGLLAPPAGTESLVAEMATATARAEFLNSCGIHAAEGERYISLFSYETAALNGLLDALVQEQGWHLLVPQGRAMAGVNRWCGEDLPAVGTRTRGGLRLSSLPFLSQPEYDRLLAMCELNAVRGEESFIRAQMLGTPLLWHIYPQEDNAHVIKLNAWLDLLLAECPQPLAAELRSAHFCWNDMPESRPADWSYLLSELPQWRDHLRKWQTVIRRHGDLVTNLMTYCK